MPSGRSIIDLSEEYERKYAPIDTSTAFREIGEERVAEDGGEEQLTRYFHGSDYLGSGKVSVDMGEIGLSETMSLAPTVLEYAGVQRPPEMTASSWRPIIEGEDDNKTSILCEYVSNNRKRKGKCVRTERYKFATWGRNVGELYDLQKDPLEENNLYDAPDYISLRDEMKDILLEKIAESEMPPYTQWLEELPKHVRDEF